MTVQQKGGATNGSVGAKPLFAPPQGVDRSEWFFHGAPMLQNGEVCGEVRRVVWQSGARPWRGCP
jgi:hypothetical protein